MSNVLIDDESSRLKQFIWEELDENFFLAIIFRSGRRYVVQRHFEQQLLDLKSLYIQHKWRRCLYEVISKSSSPIYITRNEMELMHEIFSWHLNYSNNYLKLREKIDYIIDFEDLLDCSNLLIVGDEKEKKNNLFLMQPVTTLDAARKNIEMWTNLQENFSDKNTNQMIEDYRVKRKTPPIISTKSSHCSSTTGWLQLDSKIVPFIKKHCDRLLPVDYLLKEHLISSSEDFSLRSLYLPIHSDDIQLFHTLIRQSPSHLLLTHHSLLITLDHLIFRLKRLFFIRFLSSPINIDSIDYQKVLSFNGGLITFITNKKQRIPFLYINKQKYIPQINEINLTLISTFCMANKYEYEYLRLISLYHYLSSDDNHDQVINLSSRNNLTLIPIEFYSQETFLTIISLTDFHSHEYQRRTQQQQNLQSDDDDNQQFSSASGWWQPPISSRQKRPISHLKFQRPILF